MSKNGTSLTNADVNYYAIDPWKNPFIVINETDTSSSEIVVVEEYQLCPPLFENVTDQTAIRMCDDHLVIDDSFEIIRVPYYNSRLSDLPGFSGFVPRWYIPHV